MPTIEQGVTQHLLATSAITNLVSTRIYAQQALEGADYPYLTFQRVAGSRSRTQEGPTGGVLARLQYTAHSDDYREAQSVLETLRAAMDGAGPATWNGVEIQSLALAGDRDGYSLPPDASGAGVHALAADYEVYYQE